MSRWQNALGWQKQEPANPTYRIMTILLENELELRSTRLPHWGLRNRFRMKHFIPYEDWFACAARFHFPNLRN